MKSNTITTNKRQFNHPWPTVTWHLIPLFNFRPTFSAQFHTCNYSINLDFFSCYKFVNAIVVRMNKRIFIHLFLCVSIEVTKSCSSRKNWSSQRRDCGNEFKVPLILMRYIERFAFDSHLTRKQSSKCQTLILKFGWLRATSLQEQTWFYRVPETRRWPWPIAMGTGLTFHLGIMSMPKRVKERRLNLIKQHKESQCAFFSCDYLFSRCTAMVFPTDGFEHVLTDYSYTVQNNRMKNPHTRTTSKTDEGSQLYYPGAGCAVLCTLPNSLAPSADQASKKIHMHSYCVRSTHQVYPDHFDVVHKWVYFSDQQHIWVVSGRTRSDMNAAKSSTKGLPH